MADPEVEQGGRLDQVEGVQLATLGVEPVGECRTRLGHIWPRGGGAGVSPQQLSGGADLHLEDSGRLEGLMR